MSVMQSQLPLVCACHNPFIRLLQEQLFCADCEFKECHKMGSATAEETKADRIPKPSAIIYTGGNIYPLVGGCVEKKEAIGFYGNHVVKAGLQSEVIEAMKRELPQGVQYENRELGDEHTLLPGLIEPHVHIIPTAIIMSWTDLSPFNKSQYLCNNYNMQELRKRVQAEIDEYPTKFKSGDWILAHGIDPSLMPVISEPGKKKQLQSLCCDVLDDKIEGEIPLLMVSASIHTVYVNTPALEAIYKCSEKDINKTLKIASCKDFKKIINENGGLQELQQLEWALRAIPTNQRPTDATLSDNLNCLFEIANKRGVTLMFDAGMTGDMQCCVLEKIVTGLDSNKPKVRIGYAKICETEKDAEDMTPCETMTDDPKKIYQGAVKLISDGSNQGLTGYQSKEYCCEAAHECGVFNFKPPCKFTKILISLINKKFPVMVHANGDKAINIVIEAYKKALHNKNPADLRNRIEHCSLLMEDKTMDDMKELGISPSFLIGHVGYWGNVFRYTIFDEKAEKLDRCQSALKKGMRISLHSDSAVTPIGPLRMMEQAVTRIMERPSDDHWHEPPKPSPGVLNNDEKLTGEEALKAVTYDAAWQCYADHLVGSLAPGRLADYIILEEDPVTRAKKDPCGMRNIKVLETWLGGVKICYDKIDDVNN